MQDQPQSQVHQNLNTEPNNNPYIQGSEMNYRQSPQEKLNKNNDLEAGVTSPNDIQMSIRMGFIRKVYGILSAQLLMTVALMSLAFVDSFNHYLKTNLAGFWVAMGLSLVIIIPLLCCRKVARGVPQNYILLFLWTLCESYMLATCVAFYDPKTVMLAGFMTLAVTVSLTIYAFTTKTDFTFLGGLLFCAICILFCVSLFSIIFGFMLNALYCVLGLFIYSIYLIYDTQLIIGKFGTEFNIDDYIYAALNIYLDVIQIFLYILQLIGGRR